ncbi:radical S-adenosylmethionine protein [Pseudanabaena phage Pan1]|nr:radical S-adenosylmethionine protein [Pseudanabaena phage Pan1]
MFGHNEIVGQRAFPDDDRLMVTSIFVTMQGEGPYSGLPAVFVRLSKCNLACSFCDTYFDQGDWFSLEELNRRVEDMVWDSPLSQDEYVLIITGGEPMLQKALVPFLEMQAGNWRAVQIESNGIVVQDIPDWVTLVVSPKCLEKDGQAVRYIKPSARMLERADCLKFVMEADQSSPYSDVPLWARDWRRDTGNEVYVSPINVYAREPQKAKVARNANSTTLEQRSTIEEVISFWEPGLLNLESNEANHKYTAQYAVRNGLRFQVQAHLYAGVA